MPNRVEIKGGDVLLSEPYLNDPNFSRSVIVIVESTEEGHYGLILNQKLLGSTLSDVVSVSGEAEAFELCFGGPVAPDSLHYLHVLGDKVKNCIEVGEGLYYGGEFESIKRLIEQGTIKPHEIRFFIGYSGWSEGQLEEECKRNAWLVSELKYVTVFEEDHDKMWQDVLRNMGGKFKVLSNYPIDPNLN